jgi:hypothetical protein
LANRKNVDFDLVSRLSFLLSKDDDFDPTPYLKLPNATIEKIKILHKKHIRLRAKIAKQNKSGVNP